jgi:hypothetical protein
VGSDVQPRNASIPLRKSDHVHHSLNSHVHEAVMVFVLQNGRSLRADKLGPRLCEHLSPRRGKEISRGTSLNVIADLGLKPSCLHETPAFRPVIKLSKLQKTVGAQRIRVVIELRQNTSFEHRNTHPRIPTLLRCNLRQRLHRNEPRKDPSELNLNSLLVLAPRGHRAKNLGLADFVDKHDNCLLETKRRRVVHHTALPVVKRHVRVLEVQISNRVPGSWKLKAEAHLRKLLVCRPPNSSHQFHRLGINIGRNVMRNLLKPLPRSLLLNVNSSVGAS